jgi:two-component system OmpR family sensor kinase/two-component system sensor histidine kinase QseC
MILSNLVPPTPRAESAAGWSLRGRLLTLMIAVSCALVAAGAAAMYYTARTTSQHLFDESMRQTGELLLELAQHEIEEHGPTLGEALLRAETLPGPFAFRYQIWTPELRSSYRTTDAPLTPLMPLTATGFGWASIDGEVWRSFATWNRGHTLLLQIAESLRYRRELPSAFFWALVTTLAVLLPLGSVLIWWIIAHSFRTVRTAAQLVTARTAGDLRPIDAQYVPQEVSPLLTALNRLLERMREALDLERHFTADAAHELRTPLAAIRANAQVMQGARSPEEFSHASADLLIGVDRSGRLIEQLLALARLDTGSDARQRFSVVDLATLVCSQAEEQQSFAARRQIRIETNAATAMVRGDRDLLGILLRNLVDNAIRYSPAQSRVIISCAQHEDHVELVVSDQGVGVPPAERGRIFERFYRVSGSQDYGSGLGLSIVQRIADLHDAHIEVRSGERDRGLVIVLRFPIVAGGGFTAA